VFRDPSWSQGQNCWDELGIPFIEVAPEVHQTKVTGPHVLSHAPGRGELTRSYFFLVVFFAVFLAVVFLAAFFIAIVINHLLSYLRKSKERACKGQRIFCGGALLFSRCTLRIEEEMRTSSVQLPTSNVQVREVRMFLSLLRSWTLDVGRSTFAWMAYTQQGRSNDRTMISSFDDLQQKRWSFTDVRICRGDCMG